MVQHYHVRHDVVADHDSHVPRLVLGVVTVMMMMMVVVLVVVVVVG